MTLSANTVWEVRTTGSDTNGGGFVTGATGVDRSQQDAAQYSVTDGVTNGTTTITSVTANFGTDVVGNLIYVQGGTGSVVADRYEITVRNSSTSITVDRSIGLTAGTGVTLTIGGALASPALPLASAQDNNTVWVKSGTYTITSSTVNVSNGRLSFLGKVTVRGYNLVRGDLVFWGANRPVIKAGVNSINIVTGSGNGGSIRDVILDGDRANRTGTVGISSNAFFFALNCLVRNCASNGVTGSNLSTTLCEFTNTSNHGWTGKSALLCASHDNPNGSGFMMGNSTRSMVSHCISYGNSDQGFGQLTGAMVHRCVAYGNAIDGFDVIDNSNLLVDCIAYGNTGYGFDDNNLRIQHLVNCAFGSNTLGASRTALASLSTAINTIALTANPFTDPANGDFSINNTSGGGTLLRGTGYGQILSSLGYPDIGAVQHLGTGVSGSRIFGGF